MRHSRALLMCGLLILVGCAQETKSVLTKTADLPLAKAIGQYCKVWHDGGRDGMLGDGGILTEAGADWVLVSKGADGLQTAIPTAKIMEIDFPGNRTQASN